MTYSTTSPRLTPGRWIIIYEDGLWFTDDTASYPTKATALEDISLSCLDPRRVPKVTRVEVGYYIYHSKDVDTKRFGNQYSIIRLTPSNLSHYQTLLQGQFDDDPLSSW